MKICLIPTESLHKLLDTLDEDGDGMISASELIKSVKRVRRWLLRGKFKKRRKTR